MSFSLITLISVVFSLLFPLLTVLSASPTSTWLRIVQPLLDTPATMAQEGALVQALHHLMQRSLSSAFNSWRHVAHEMRHYGESMVLAVTRWQHSYMSSAFYTWLDWIEERQTR